MVLYFIQQYQLTGRFPKNILDNNVRTDYRKIEQLAGQFEDKETIANIIKGNEISTILVERFPLKEMYVNKENFVSLLFYMGMLTIKGERRNKVLLGIPNYVIRMIYWEYFLELVRTGTDIRKNELEKAMIAMQINGNISLFKDFLQDILKQLSNRDLMNFDEKYCKAVMMTLINLDGLYFLQSEQETDEGYVDLLLTKNLRYAKDIKYEWCIELKYIKESGRNQLETVNEKAKEQLTRYAESDFVQSKWGGDSLKKAVIIFIGKSEIVAELLD
jgi:hypothetical protein